VLLREIAEIKRSGMLFLWTTGDEFNPEVRSSRCR